jgi:hypothetical protein
MFFILLHTDVTGSQIDCHQFVTRLLFIVEHPSAPNPHPQKNICHLSTRASSQEVNAKEPQAKKLGKGGIPWRG